jgi:hypothetical protein
MSKGNLTTDERRLRDLLRLWTVLFGLGALSFAVDPDRTIDTLGLLPGEPVPTGDRFWNALGVSLMATLTTLCGMAALDVRRHRRFILPVLVSKAVSSGMYAWRYAGRPARTSYLAGAVCDGSIFAITLQRYLAAAS